MVAKNPGKKQPGLRFSKEAAPECIRVSPGHPDPGTPGAPRRCGSGGWKDLTALRARFGLALEANRAAWFKVASPEIIQVSPGHLDPAAHDPPRLDSSCYLRRA